MHRQMRSHCIECIICWTTRSANILSRATVVHTHTHTPHQSVNGTSQNNLILFGDFVISAFFLVFCFCRSRRLNWFFSFVLSNNADTVNTVMFMQNSPQRVKLSDVATQRCSSTNQLVACQQSLNSAVTSQNTVLTPVIGVPQTKTRVLHSLQLVTSLDKKM